MSNSFTNKYKVILASSSNTRISHINKYIEKVVTVKHSVDESELKKSIKQPETLVMELAKRKAQSVKHKFPNDIIIGSDQILLCDEKIINKPTSTNEAIKNLLFLRNKKHSLLSSIFVLKRSRFYFKQLKSAHLFFKDIKRGNIEDYVKKNKKTVFSTVGSYKIEENNKHKFLEILSGDIEVILGFPLKDFLRKFNEEE